MSLDSSLRNQQSTLTCLLSFWSIIKLYHHYCYCCIILWFIISLNRIKIDYSILLCHYYLFSSVFIILFIFSFSTSNQFYFHLSNSTWSCLAFVVLSCICVIVFILIFIITEPKMWVKASSFILFFRKTYMKIRGFFGFFFFKGTCFKFYLIVVLIFYLYFCNMSQSA